MQRRFIRHKKQIKKAKCRLARARKRFIRCGAGDKGKYNIAYHTAFNHRQSLEGEHDRIRLAHRRALFDAGQSTRIIAHTHAE